MELMTMFGQKPDQSVSGKREKIKDKNTGMFTRKCTNKQSVLERVASFEMQHCNKDGPVTSGFGFFKNPLGINPFLSEESPSKRCKLDTLRLIEGTKSSLASQTSSPRRSRPRR